MALSFTGQQKHALIIGINKYLCDPLVYCINDAEDLKIALECINFSVLISKDCNRTEFNGVINKFVEKIQRDHLVLFYFAGHGKLLNDEHYLLPSDYNYTHNGLEQDYIVNHGISVNYIIKKIDDRQPRVVIYLFDCCRIHVRTRTTNINRGLSLMNPKSDALIVYACTPGKGVQDETRNNRNGSFMENLKKYIRMPNKDIEEIMKTVANDVASQTNGYQVLHRTTTFTKNVFLVDNRNQVPNKRSSNAVTTSSNEDSKELETPRNLSPLKKVSPRGRLLPTQHQHKTPLNANDTILASTNVAVTPRNEEQLQWPSSSINVTTRNQTTRRPDCNLELPTCDSGQNTSRQCPQHSTRIDGIPRISQHNQTHTDNISQTIVSIDLGTTTKPSNCQPQKQSRHVDSTKMSTRHSVQLAQPTKSMTTARSHIFDKYFEDDDQEGNADKESVPITDACADIRPNQEKRLFIKKILKNADHVKPNEQVNKHSSTGIDTSDDHRRPSSSIQLNPSAPSITNKKDYNDLAECPTTSSQRSKDLIVFVQSLERRYELHLPVNSTIEYLKKTLWEKIDINTERCQQQSHVLLLFTQRMHIFLSDEKELVNEFMKLTPSEPHFYIYALKRPAQSNEMYTYQTKISDIFADDTNWWTPVHFVEDAQLPRPQSVLLSSLHALRLFFYKRNEEWRMWRKAMEAQFFFHLRKYLFPPAVLALKHAIEGSLFWFEKPLIVDALIQSLALLCPSKIKRNELCDCIPLIFCWLFEQCNPNATASDFYELINLIDLNVDEKRYLDDPVTAVTANPVPLKMKERAKIFVDTIRHVDIRSLTRYMQNKRDYANIMYCKCDEYLIYNPPKTTSIPIVTINRLSDDQVKQTYEIMAQKYKSFTLITRSALRSDINDQLVIMQDRTVALIFTRKMGQRPKTENSTTDRPVEHVFEIFNPLQYTVGKRQYVAADQLYQVKKKGNQDPNLPEHLFSNVCEVPHAGSVHDPNVNAPIQQITIIALDISRSMIEKSASPDTNDYKTVLDMSIIMLGTMCDNTVFERSTHAFGLIHFGTVIEVICPITQNRDDFEKALSVQPKTQEWTNMYDALNKGTSLIVTYERNNKKSIAHDCKRLIICISDGIDNRSEATISQLQDRLQQHNIIIDFVSFLRDDLLKNGEKEKVFSFRQLCKKTHGYAYKNLPITNIELGATFEREAAVWVCERESRSFGDIDKPVHKIPAELHHKATDKVPTQYTQNIQNTQNYIRVLREANNIMKTKPDNINVYVCRNNIFFWKAILSGPPKTLYEGGHWVLYVHFSSEYPRQPPTIRFVTEIYHVNVSADGKICHGLFDRGWAKEITMIEVFQTILQLLGEPNSDDAVSTEKAQLKNDNMDEYNRQVKECTKQHGCKSLDQLKQEFELEDF